MLLSLHIANKKIFCFFNCSYFYVPFPVIFPYCIGNSIADLLRLLGLFGYFFPKLLTAFDHFGVPFLHFFA